VGGTPENGKILLALDASVSARKVIDYVSAMVDSSQWDVTLFHAIRDIDRSNIQKTEQIISSLYRRFLRRPPFI